MSDHSLVTLLQLFGIGDFTEFSSYEEMAAREKFVSEINPALSRPAKVIGPYQLSEEHPCGLSTCHQGNKKGLLVLTESGVETPIGHQCGGREFGADWKELQRQAQRSSKIRADVEIILAARRNISALRADIQALRDAPRGAHWLYWKLDAFEKDAPSSLLKELRERARRGEYTVYLEKRIEGEGVDLRTVMAQSLMDKSQKEEAADAPKKVRFERVSQGDLRGIEIFAKSIRQLVAVELTERVSELERLDLLALNVREFSTWARRCEGLRGHLRDAQELCVRGCEFFQRGNFERLPLLRLPGQDGRAVLRLRKYFTEG